MTAPVPLPNRIPPSVRLVAPVPPSATVSVPVIELAAKSTAIKQAAPIILITGMGGALGAVIEQMHIENYINNLTINSN